MSINWDEYPDSLYEYAMNRWVNHSSKHIYEEVQLGKIDKKCLKCVDTTVEIERLFPKLNNMLNKKNPKKQQYFKILLFLLT